MSSWIHHTRRRSPQPGEKSALASLAPALLTIADAGLAGVIFIAPLLLGGRHDLGRFVFVAFIVVAAIAWFARQAVLGQGRWTRRAAHLLLGCTAIVLLAQLLPLPADWLNLLSPRTAALLPLWTGGADPGELGRWNTLSLTPEATRLSLAMLAAYALLFVTVSQRIESREDVTRILRWIALAAAAMAILGLLQAAAPNGRFLWIYEHPSETTFDRLSGPFANRNHFAHFLVLGIAPLAAWLTVGTSNPPPSQGGARGGIPDRRHSYTSVTRTVIALPLLLTAITILLSSSRGGAIALAVAVAVFIALLYRSGQLQGRRLGILAAGGLAVFFALSVVGYESVSRRLNSLVSTSIDEIDEQGARRQIWTANVAAIKSGGFFGAGAGSHREIYPIYLDDPPTKEFSHAENGYLQIVTENGVPGAVLLAAALTLCGGWCYRAVAYADSPQSIAYAAACIASLVASAVHSALDFVWYIPACLTITLILAACVMQLGEINRKADYTMVRTFSWRRAGAVNLAGAALLLATFAVVELFPPAAAALHWDAYHRTSNAQRDFALKLLAMPPDKAALAHGEAHVANVAALESMIGELEQAVAWRPSFAAAHRQLANRYLELFHLRAEATDNFMPAPQIREAAIASQFGSSADLNEWLTLAFGENSRLLYPALAHARVAARLSPLQGSPYVRLAALGFLQNYGHAAADAYLQQALLVRPHDGDLLFEIGAELCVRGNVDAGLQRWSHALQLRGEHRMKVARAVAGRLAWANLTELFQPAWDTLPEFWKVYRHADPDNVSAFLVYAAAQTRREAADAPREKAAVLIRRLAQVQLDAGQIDAAIASLNQSHVASPDDYATRRMLGMVLADANAEANRSDAAAAHLRWCLDREPNDPRAAAVLTKITSSRMRVARPEYTKGVAARRERHALRSTSGRATQFRQ